MSKFLTTQDLEMVDDVYGAMLTEAPSSHKLIIWAIAAMMLCFLVWSSLATLDRVTRGTGKVIPSSQVQVIQSLDGGILQELYVQEGMLVKKGQPLVRIDDTRFRADAAQQQQEVYALRADIVRLTAELNSIFISDVAQDWREQVKIIKKPLSFRTTSSVKTANW
ncbi:biotin/lipoyl-binding protein [Shewanella dokdonensis]|uniref:biotin/lipoyl-binding protein n=1 Tax=Shewanella dokdonensis TaxID=712036 RepID=UPI001FD0CFF5|nr:biotin/lipoyl-binding protein [Shewanella dokdonensis]